MPQKNLPGETLTDPALPRPALSGPALPGPALPGQALPRPALPGSALPGPASPGPASPGPALLAPDLPESADHSMSIILIQGDFIGLNEHPITDDYEFSMTLGTGGYGEVRLANHISTGTQRAIKSIPLKADSGQNIEKLMKEVSILKRLDHPNIIRIYDVYKNKNTLYIVTELCKGGQLLDRIQLMSQFSENQAASFMLDMVSGIVHCHKNKIVHRDLKPENILFESQEKGAKLKLIDFGLARFVDDSRKLKKAIGSLYYVAPEVLAGHYDIKVDVWSLGVIMYLMLCGRPPFNGESQEEIFAKIKKSPLEFTDSAWTKVSEPAKVLLGHMLAKKPAARFTIDQVYKDHWLQSRGLNKVPDKILKTSVMRDLAGFSTQGKLQRAIYAYIVSQYMDNALLNKLREVFRNLDKDGDGYLSKLEVKNSLDKLGLRFNFDEIRKGCDTDRNGYVNYSEYLAATVNKAQAYNREILKRVFTRFDKNKDGVICLDELKKAIGGNNNQDAAFRRMIEEADKNGDGAVDLNEFLEYMTSRYHLEATAGLE